MRKLYLSAVAIVSIACLSLPEAHGDEKPSTQGEKYKIALDFCGAYAVGTFNRALERKVYKSSAQHHAAVPQEKPGEGTAKKKHEMIEMVHAFPDKKPHELAILGYARCIDSFADSFWGYDDTKPSK